MRSKDLEIKILLENERVQRKIMLKNSEWINDENEGKENPKGELGEIVRGFC